MKEKLKKHKAWFILLGVYIVLGLICTFLLPNIHCSSMYKPKQKENDIQREYISVGTLTKINSIVAIDDNKFHIVTETEDYDIILEGIDITAGFSVNGESYNATIMNENLETYEGQLYFEKSEFIKDKCYSGYLWFVNNKIITYESLHEAMYNAMLIHGNFANVNNSEHKYYKEFTNIENNRAKIDNSLLLRLLKQIGILDLQVH